MALLTFWASCIPFITLVLCSRFPGTLLFVFLVPSTFRADSAHLELSHHFRDYLVFSFAVSLSTLNICSIVRFPCFLDGFRSRGYCSAPFRAFPSLGHFSSATFACFISFVFPLGFRADISFLCLIFECFVILLIPFGSVRFLDGFRSRFTSTFVTHFVLTSFCSRFPLAFRTLVFTLSFSGCCCFRTLPGPHLPTPSFFPHHSVV